jgi:PTH1 family peptidyl-tRNA hydrolase
MRLLVGLGNPGSRHERNRHNIGFMAVDAIVRRHSFPGWRDRFKGEISEGAIGGRKVMLLKPMTYMNVSGEAVLAAASFYKIPPQEIAVLHDELDLAPGKLRVKRGGGAAGHNGGSASVIRASSRWCTPMCCRTSSPRRWAGSSRSARRSRRPPPSSSPTMRTAS